MAQNFQRPMHNTGIDSTYDERIIALDRVTRVVAGGRRFRFRATVVVGDGKAKVGVGVGKGRDVASSIAKASAKARRDMISFPMAEGTIPHEITYRFGSATVLMKPASPGTGVIAGGSVRSVLEAAGVHDILTKALGSSNKINNAYATVAALGQLTENEVLTRTQAQKAEEVREERLAETQAPAKSKTKKTTGKPVAKATTEKAK